MWKARVPDFIPAPLAAGKSLSLSMPRFRPVESERVLSVSAVLSFFSLVHDHPRSSLLTAGAVQELPVLSYLRKEINSIC